ncbi:MAG: alkaline phosphatase family protein [Aggregatilineales bacterium]
MPNKLILVMIDGVSADTFKTQRGRLPNLSLLAQNGLVIENLHSERLGTSLPGRTGILTGVTADVSGVYANMIWDAAESRFRYANPDDIRVPTLPARMTSAGRKSATIGFGMVRPEDATIFKPPWWVGEYVQRARDVEPVPSDASWQRVHAHQNAGDLFNSWCESAGYPQDWSAPHDDSSATQMMYGFINDHHAVNWAGICASAPDAPDLIMTETMMTDTLQHYTGYNSPYSHFSFAEADALIGVLMARLRAGGVADEWNIAIMSDHGHSPIETAIYTNVILPDVRVQSEGSVLLVAPRDPAELAHVTRVLGDYGCEQMPVDFVPEDQREPLTAFVAPDGMDFEEASAGITTPTGAPLLKSNHGLRPGLPGDDRFAVFYGPDVNTGTIDFADAVQIAPTCARLLGLPLDGFMGEPLL